MDTTRAAFPADGTEGVETSGAQVPPGRTESPAGAGVPPGAEGATTVTDGGSGPEEPAATRGQTSIADGVVEKIAGMAAAEVTGVHSLGGGGLARALGAARDRVPGGRSNVARGVHAEVGQRQTAIDLDVVVEYGVPIPEVAAEIRENVITALERMTGLEVVEVNVAVGDVHLPDDGPADTRLV
ncbi:Asp23/Gls24 family envelope stress response protein [Streptomyces avicenniae]|uniref:Asp23/Gls24 family envelope stress response protein n=1 Tax=Streptomyces avicenniae TaxID=500153 RepID=UPI00069A65EC|nr:Asp23/Gls24 family envelope stress response protein [Streptomyces avicenniae]